MYNKENKKKYEKDLFNLVDQGKLQDSSNLLKSVIDDKRSALFSEWLYERSDEEAELLNQAIEYEATYFSDVILIDYENELTEHVDNETGKVSSYDFLREYEINISTWRFKIIPDNNQYGGQCCYPERMIEIVESHKNNKLTLLHEMIHAYELMLLNECEFLKQFVLVKLYDSVSRRVQNLNKLISQDNHFLLSVHSIFFLLKSLDLDLRLDEPLGSVYSYRRTKFFAAR